MKDLKLKILKIEGNFESLNFGQNQVFAIKSKIKWTTME